MGLISLAELYFRSLKRIKVLSLLTKYLLLYKRVSIPHIGSFEIVQQPPQLNIGEKMICAPFFITRYKKAAELTEHQFDFFASAGTAEKEQLRNELFSFGEHLASRIRSNPFQWNGFGTLRYTSNEIVFEPNAIGIPSMTPAPAEKVKRENVQHRVLVGDQQMTGQQVTEVFHAHEGKRPLYILIGWVVLALAVIVLLVLLYLGKFQVTATGLKWKVL